MDDMEAAYGATCRIDTQGYRQQRKVGGQKISSQTPEATSQEPEIRNEKQEAINKKPKDTSPTVKAPP